MNGINDGEARSIRNCGMFLGNSGAVLGLRDVEGVEHEDVVVVLRQSDQIAFRCDLEATASTHLNIGTLKLADKRAVSLEDAHVKAVAVRVAHQNVASIAHVDAVREICDVLASDATQELAFVVEHDHTVSLKETEQ